MPSGFHHLTAVDICQPTLQLKLQIEAEKVLSSSDDEFFHKKQIDEEENSSQNWTGNLFRRFCLVLVFKPNLQPTS